MVNRLRKIRYLQVNNIDLAVAEVLPYPPLYFNYAKIYISLGQKYAVQYNISIISTYLFWSVIKSHELKILETLFKIINKYNKNIVINPDI